MFIGITHVQIFYPISEEAELGDSLQNINHHFLWAETAFAFFDFSEKVPVY